MHGICSAVLRWGLSFGLLSFGLLVLAACKVAPKTPSQLELSELRERARLRPSDAALHKLVAEAEMFHPLGEPKLAADQVARALSLDPEDMRLRMLAALHAEVHGDPDRALAGFLSVLSAYGASDDPYAGHMAEFAVHAVASLEGGIVGYAEHVERALSAVTAGLPAPARWAALDLRLHLAFLRDDGDAVTRLADEGGCMTRFSAAGPFGPRPLLGFDVDHGVALDAELQPSYDLGPARGVRATRELGARGCSVNLGGDPIAAGGVRYITGTLQIAHAGRYLLRFDSPNTGEVFVNGHSVVRVDRRRHPLARLLYVPVELSAGTHRVTVKVASRHPDPVVRLAWYPVRARDAAALALPPHDQGPYPLYLRATLQLLRGDVVAARHSLRRATADAKVSPLLLTQRANALFNDPLGPSDVRQDEARRLLIASLKRDPGLWNPTVQLASLAANNGRAKEAIGALRKARERFPKVPAVGLSLLELLDSESWHAEADEVIASLRAQVPDACGPMAAELGALQRRSRYPAVHAMAERIMTCNARSNARYADLMRRNDWHGARRELQRLSRLDPPQSHFGWRLAELELARRLGETERAQAVIDQLRQDFPRYPSAVTEAFDLQLAGGHVERSAQILNGALGSEPGEMAGLWRLRSLAGQPEILADYRRDGLAAIKAFEAAGRSYSQPQVLVFDYMATRIFDDGSSIELVHTVQRAQSDEAVDELAEVEVPEGSRVLKLRTIKADGRVLEPDLIAGKDTLSLPSVAVGDYVEFEYLRQHDPSSGFPGGYLSDRFYFQSFEVPFDHSEMVFVTPNDIALELDIRGPAPVAQEEVRGPLRVTRFLVTQSAPLSPEPGSVTAREYIPSIRVGRKATWPAFVDSVREVLVDRDLVDPALVELASEIVGEAAPEDHLLRAQRVYAWVLENVEHNNDSFSQAAVMLSARSGNRARVLHYLLGLAGVHSTLAIARGANADLTESEIPDTEGFEHLLVRVDVGSEPIWLFSSIRHAPFGFLPALLRGQQARLLVPGATLVQLPAARAGEDRRAMDIMVAVTSEGGAHFEVVEQVAGAGAIAWRSQFEEIPPAELEKRFEQDYVARLVPGATLASLQIAGRTNEHPTVTLTYGFDVVALARHVEGGWALPPLLTTELAANYARVSTRTTVLLVGRELDTDVTLRYRFPEGARRPPPARDTSLAGPQGRARFAIESRYEDETLVVRRRVDVPIMRVAPDKYAAFAKFCHHVDQIESRELVFRVGQ